MLHPLQMLMWLPATMTDDHPPPPGSQNINLEHRSSAYCSTNAKQMCGPANLVCLAKEKLKKQQHKRTKKSPHDHVAS